MKFFYRLVLIYYCLFFLNITAFGQDKAVSINPFVGSLFSLNNRTDMSISGNWRGFSSSFTYGLGIELLNTKKPYFFSTGIQYSTFKTYFQLNGIPYFKPGEGFPKIYLYDHFITLPLAFNYPIKKFKNRSSLYLVTGVSLNINLDRLKRQLRLRSASTLYINYNGYLASLNYEVYDVNNVALFPAITTGFRFNYNINKNSALDLKCMFSATLFSVASYYFVYNLSYDSSTPGYIRADEYANSNGSGIYLTIGYNFQVPQKQKIEK